MTINYDPLGTDSLPVNSTATPTYSQLASTEGNTAATAETTTSANSPSASTSSTSTPTADQTNQQSASSLISAFLSSVPGLSSLDPNGTLAAWMNGQAGTLAGQGMDPTTILNTIESTMNNPSGDPQAQAVFDSLFPGYNQKIQNGTTNSDGSYTGIAGYIAYAAQIQQFGQQAGLTSGTISATDIGNLWAGNVSSAEVSQRITDATVAATSAPQQVQDYLATNYGMTPSALASYYLNPANTLQTITQNMNSGMVGGEANATGFNQNLSVAQSQALGAFLANGASSGSANQVGGVNNVTAQQANSFFTSNIGTNAGTGGSIGSLSELAQGGFENVGPGASTTGTVNEQTLLSAGEGNAAAIAQTAQAQQARTAGSKGGGGATTTANGAVGLGFAAS